MLKIWHIFVFVVFVDCALSGYTGRQKNKVQAEKLTEQCRYDEDCSAIPHSYCRGNQECDCRQGYTPSEDETECLATIGAECRVRSDCSAVPGAHCITNICTCKENYTPSSDGYMCERKTSKFQEGCHTTADCRQIDYIECISGKCLCRAGFHYVEQENECVSDHNLRDPCAEHFECYSNTRSNLTVECAQGVGPRLCKCKEPYYEENHECKLGGAMALQSLSVFSFFFISILICSLVH